VLETTLVTLLLQDMLAEIQPPLLQTENSVLPYIAENITRTSVLFGQDKEPCCPWQIIVVLNEGSRKIFKYIYFSFNPSLKFEFHSQT
jgi:hypothetical protein